MIRNELISNGVVTGVTRTSQPMTEHWSDTWGFEWPGSTANDLKTDFNYFASDEGFVQTLGLKLIAGRDINTQIYLTDSNAMLLNEAAVKIMRLKDPVGAMVKYNNTNWHVVGVVKDFILESPYQPIAPMIMVGPKELSFYVMNMKFNPANSISENLNKAESIFKKYNPSYPFEYNFLDKQYEAKFANEKRTGEMSALFAGLTIFISCLGLFGLASFHGGKQDQGNRNQKSTGCVRFWHYTITIPRFSKTRDRVFSHRLSYRLVCYEQLASVLSLSCADHLVGFCFNFFIVDHDRFADNQFSIDKSSNDESGEKS